MELRSTSDFLCFLTETRRISAEACQRVKTVLRDSGQPIDLILRELGIMPETAIAAAFADFLNVPIARQLDPKGEFTKLIEMGVDFARDKAIVPWAAEGGQLVFAMANPLDSETLAAVDFFFELPFRIEIASRSAIEEFLRSFAQGDTPAVEEAGFGAADIDLQRLQDVARDAPVVRLVARIIQRAVDEKATDIHIEPGPETMRIRFRRDGMLAAVEDAPITLHTGVVSRLKILARLNIAERRLPQDGRVRLPIRGQEIDFRLSVVPAIHGETVVLRILDRESIRLDLAALGYDEQSSQSIRQIVRRPSGMVLVTGPTGSGKTTTLYAILAELNRPEVKIFTVEDPVEYRLSGITQVQIDHR